MSEFKLTKQQARVFLLSKHGLLGAYRFKGKQLVADKKAKRLDFHHYWPENGAEADEAFRQLLNERIDRFAAFNGCETFCAHRAHFFV